MRDPYAQIAAVDKNNQEILDGWLTPTWEENPITAKKKRIAEAQMIKHEENAKELWQALDDLSFECFGAIGTMAPSIDTYNRTFKVVDKLRKEYSVK